MNGQKLLNFFDKFITIITIIASLLLVLKIFVFQQVNVVGQSMQPTFLDGEKLVLNKTEMKLARGEVVSVYENREMAQSANILTKTFPSLSGVPIKFLLKRVIALPGEEIEMIGSRIVIYNSSQTNGKVLDETYLTQSVKDQMEAGCFSYDRYFKRFKIPDNNYFLMGDNRCNSFDSRDSRLGPFSESMLLGGVVFRYWPLETYGGVEIPQEQFREIDPITNSDLGVARKVQNETTK